jgi:hypothetical protein
MQTLPHSSRCQLTWRLGAGGSHQVDRLPTGVAAIIPWPALHGRARNVDRAAACASDRVQVNARVAPQAPNRLGSGVHLIQPRLWPPASCAHVSSCRVMTSRPVATCVGVVVGQQSGWRNRHRRHPQHGQETGTKGTGDTLCMDTSDAPPGFSIASASSVRTTLHWR